jgi:CubicO group peptidase (beta-lactamase class C family)
MFGVVGLAWLVQVSGDEPIVGACGVRKSLPEADAGEAAAQISGDEIFHWGSCSKALSATLLLVLIEDPSVPLGWDTDLEHALPRLELPKAMGAITVRQLLTHRSGLPADLDEAEGGGEEQAALADATKDMTPTEARLAYVRAIAAKELVHEPGERYGPYSNAGYSVLGAVAEQAMGVPWEELVVSRIGTPLGMTSLGFGFPGELAGHDEEGTPQGDGVDDVRWHAPAYTCHATLEDWARFTAIHLAALRGEAGAGAALGLSDGVLSLVQLPVSPAKAGESFDGAEGPEGYAMGWKSQWKYSEGEVVQAAEPTGVLWHCGTNFFFNSTQYLDTDSAGGQGLQVLVASNSGSMVARLAIREGIEAVLALLAS